MLKTFGSMYVDGVLIAHTVPVWITHNRKSHHWKGAIMLPPSGVPKSGTVAMMTLEDGRSGEIAVEQTSAGPDGHVLLRFVGMSPLALLSK